MKTIQFFLTIFFILIGFGASAQQQEILTNETIISMYTKKLPTSIIMGKIKVAKNSFDVSTDALIVLIQNKLPEEIVNAMVEAANDPAKYFVKVDPNNPMDMHESGIYYLKRSGDSTELIQMEPSSYSQVKSKGGLAFALTYGIAKVKQGVTLDGKDAHLQLSERPEFYFYFDLSGKAFNQNSNWWFSAATSPSEFQLVALSVKEKTREVIMGSVNISSSSSGVADENKAEFKYEKIASGIYRVYFEKPLLGEFCFVYAGSLPKDFTAINKVYDFGIK